MKFIDMFCGIGTIRMGMEKAGHECVYSIEWDKWKRKIYSIIFGGEPEGADITTVNGIRLPRADCWCFGAPCQDFSIAGKRAGLEGDRSSLVREVFRLVRETKEECRPKYLFYENVKGMFSSNKGLDYFQILCEMDELGYDIEWQLLNSKDFGVPQNRERVFTIGHLRGRSGRKVFPIGGSNNEVTLKQLIPGSDAQRVYDSNGLARTLKAEGGGQGAKTGLYLCKLYKQDSGKPFMSIKDASICDIGSETASTVTSRYYKGIGAHKDNMVLDVRAILRPVRTEYGKEIRKKYEAGEIEESRHNMTKLEPRTDGISNTISTVQKDNLLMIPVAEATKKGYAEAYEGDSINLAVPGSKTRRGRVGKGIANTLDTSCNQGTLVNSRIRRLTPKECWRLQGIPDEITDKVIAAGISDTQMYRGAGDATTVPVIYEIAKRMS